MDDFLTAAGLVLVIEGALYALFPRLMRKGMILALATPENQMRATGVALAALGVIGVWMVRG